MGEEGLKCKQPNFGTCIPNPCVILLLNYHKKTIMLVERVSKNSTAEGVLSSSFTVVLLYWFAE